MNAQKTPETERSHPVDPLTNQPVRHHTYDGIQEFDNKLPNWWLWTLWLAVMFAVSYWCVGHWWGRVGDPGVTLEQAMQERAMAAAKNAGTLTDDGLWKMSRDPAVVSAGKTTFLTTCAPCHQPDLSGKIGPNLKDNIWIHGGKPTEIVNTITNGVAAKGMPTWGPILGRKRIVEVASFILSYHDPSEKVVVGTSSAPNVGGAAPAPAADSSAPAPSPATAAPAQAPQ
jgi:cytochrome c oxidase cbb3-type subunit 3